MKLLLTIFLSFSSSFTLAQSKLCEVYGISDSPQKLDCKLGSEEIKLRCLGGAYFLNGATVNVAYHEEVEDGPVPLVFRTDDTRFSVLIYSPRRIEGELSRSSRQLTGSCRL